MTIDTKRLATDAAYWRECGAPEDATHFSPEKADFDPCWMKFDGVWRAKYIGSTRDNWGVDDPYDNPERYIPRPQSEWVDGLPPVGGECEVYHYEQWRKCEILAHRHGLVLYYVPGFIEQVTGSTSGPWFRRIPTSEQLQRKEVGKLVREAYLEGAADHVGGLVAITDAILAKYNLEPKP